MQIRRIEERDEAAFRALNNAFYHTGIRRPIPLQHARDTFAALMDGAPLLDCLIAEEEDTPVGYVLLSLSWSNQAGGLTVSIEEVYVSDATRRQGVGRAMLETVHTRWPNARQFCLAPDSQRAAAFFSPLGYRRAPDGRIVGNR